MLKMFKNYKFTKMTFQPMKKRKSLRITAL